MRLPKPATPLAAEISDAQPRGSEQDNKEVIQRGYAAFASGDVDTVMSLFDDDIEWVQPGDSTVSGTFHGKTELMEHLGRLAENGLTVKLNRLIAEGDTVVAITEVTAGGESGQDADVFTIRDGKIAKWIRVKMRQGIRCASKVGSTVAR
jgi:ketosteroid isomerase-like protein